VHDGEGGFIKCLINCFNAGGMYLMCVMYVCCGQTILRYIGVCGFLNHRDKLMDKVPVYGATIVGKYTRSPVSNCMQLNTYVSVYILPFA
jgi:hypothetical protein